MFANLKDKIKGCTNYELIIIQIECAITVYMNTNLICNIFDVEFSTTMSVLRTLDIQKVV